MPTPVYCFDGWRLDAGRRQLFRPDGTEARLTSYEHDILAIFCRNPQQLITRLQLAPRVNGKMLIFDRAIDVRIMRLRRKIEANPRDPTFIKTIRQNGYWFAPDVTTE
jgi:two-component system OmpR family response regulator